MRSRDVKIGMKVVPLRKTVEGWNGLDESAEWYSAKAVGYLIVTDWEDEENCWILSARTLENNPHRSGDFFNSRDFKPYEE